MIQAVLFSILAATLVIEDVFGEQCHGNGFSGCECNILGACDNHQMPVAGLNNCRLTGYAPIGIEQFHHSTTDDPSNLAYLCEAQHIAILYDCNARIPLYTATVITGEQLQKGESSRPKKKTWKESNAATLASKFQQTLLDYRDAADRKLCYESNQHEFVADIDWFRAKNHGTVPRHDCETNFPKHVKAPMTKGHMIASAYGMDDPAKSDTTFTLTNIVPQFGAFNNGPWSASEEGLIEWGQTNCATAQNSNVRMYIVVGAIPSTFGSVNPRFFGASGFSEFQGFSQRQDTYSDGSGNKEYRVNTPLYMWTAACCTFQSRNEKGQMQAGTQSIAFYRRNNPSEEECTETTPAEMFTYFKTIWPSMTTPRLFPQNDHC